MCATVKTGTPGHSDTSHVLICSYQVEFNDLVSATPRVSRVSPALSLAVTPRDLDQWGSVRPGRRRRQWTLNRGSEVIENNDSNDHLRGLDLPGCGNSWVLTRQPAIILYFNILFLQNVTFACYINRYQFQYDNPKSNNQFDYIACNFYSVCLGLLCILAHLIHSSSKF